MFNFKKEKTLRNYFKKAIETTTHIVSKNKSDKKELHSDLLINKYPTNNDF